MLSKEGNAFAASYFDFENGCYLDDYEQLLANDLATLYHVEDNWENYRIIQERIDARYRDWKNALG